MAYVPDCDNDIFISYSHVDNKPLADQPGMVSTLHQFLEDRVRQLLGSTEVALWRDSRLHGNEFFDDAIEQQLLKVAVMISVLSPMYFASHWCLRELDGFINAKPEGLRIGATQSRLFKAIKTDISDVPPHKRRPAIQSLLEYAFYEVEQETRRPREFQFMGAAGRDAYFKRLDDLANDIAGVLRQMSGRASLTRPASLKTIYLAETSSEMREIRDQVRRELSDRGHVVLPERSLATDAETLDAEVKRCLDLSDVSVHLIGSRYGFVPEGAKSSVVWIQNELAKRAAETKRLKRILWVSSGLPVTEETQRAAVEALKADLREERNVELLQGSSVEALKRLIVDEITGDGASEALGEAAGARDTASVYVLCVEEDLRTVEPLQDVLHERGLEVILPAREGGPHQRRKDHEDQLGLCDGVLIYYGAGNELWLREKQKDLKRARVRRHAPFVVRGMYVGPTLTEAKEKLMSHEWLIYKNFEPFQADTVRPFIDTLVHELSA